MKRLIFFDIDGTLIRQGSELGKIHHESFINGFKSVYNINVVDDDFKGYSGNTDTYVIKNILKRKGFEDSEISEKLPLMYEEMLKYFEENIGKIDYRKTIIDGVIETLDILGKNENNILGLLTGNIIEIAKIKVKLCGIDNYFKVGGFGDYSDLRTSLIDKAIKEAIGKKLVYKIDMKQVYVVGDTKHDIISAKERGAISIAVTTGRFNKTELEIYKPDYLLSNLVELKDKVVFGD